MIIILARQSLLAFVATLSFSIIFNTPRKELIYCGIAGGISWFICELVVRQGDASYITLGSFLSTLVITAISRFLSYRRKMPLTIYLIAGILPLVPGAGIYYTMYDIINNNNIVALSKGIETLKISGVISIGMMSVLSLPRKLFDL